MATRSTKKRGKSTTRGRSSSAKRPARKSSEVSSGWSIPMFGLGLVLLAMYFVEGESGWRIVRGAMFGVFGLTSLFLAVGILYLAVLVAGDRPMISRLFKCLLLIVFLAGIPTVFSSVDITGQNARQVIQMLYLNGQDKLWSGGALGSVVGGTLLAFCGRPAANLIMLILVVVGVMVFLAITPGDVVRYFKNRADDHRQLTREKAPANEQPDPNSWQARRSAREAWMQEKEEQRRQRLARQQEEQARQRALQKARAAEYDIQLATPAEKPAEPAPAPVPAASAESVEPIEIGPGGTFGLDPLREVLSEMKPEDQPPTPEPEEEEEPFETPISLQDPRHIEALNVQPEEEIAAQLADQAEHISLQDDLFAPWPAAPAAPATPVTPTLPVQPLPAQKGSAAARQTATPDPELASLIQKAVNAPAMAEAEAAARKADGTAKSRDYNYPPLSLFEDVPETRDTAAQEEMKHNAEVLVGTLESFGVKTRILDICRGPSVTRYELQPLAGVKISRITSLSDDIALNLATAGVRIEAPIPGKPAVGIEVPNKIKSSVNIRALLESQNYIKSASPLTMALGKDIAGTCQMADLCKMPHLLIAGSTGSGKSVCVNSIIISFLYKSSPEDVRLLLIDPKVVELAEYNGIPHLLMPVVTEPRKAAGALGAMVAKMEQRYRTFAENNVRDIKTYNRLAQSQGLEKMPYIAIVIDELADLMMVAGKEVEDYICRIAQKARAAGMHLVVATQRPSVDVITGLIKANIPSRIAFAVSSQVDSRTILDGAGAEKLLGMGDMLFMPVGASKPVRIQGTYVKDQEISAVLDFVKKNSEAQYDETAIADMEKHTVAEASSESGGESDDSHDSMFEAAVEAVLEAGQASTSLLQRRCKLGYARAARIMDEMEQEGVIGPYEGAKPRKLLIDRAGWEEHKMRAGAAAEQE